MWCGDEQLKARVRKELGLFLWMSIFFFVRATLLSIKSKKLTVVS